MRLAGVRGKILYSVSYLSRSSGPLKVVFIFLLLVGLWLQVNISSTCVRKTKPWLLVEEKIRRMQDNVVGSRLVPCGGGDC